MSSTVTIVCDKCSDVIVSGRTLLHTSAGPLRQRRGQIDLCESCLTGFEAWLSGNGQAPDPIEQRAARHPAARAEQPAEPGTRPKNRGRKPGEARS